MYALRSRLDDGPQAGLAVPERVLHAFALVYVGLQNVPTENGPARVPTGNPTILKPTIRAVEASDARLDVIGLTRCDRLGKDLDEAREVIRMNRIAGLPLLQFLQCPAAVFDDFVVDGVDATRRRQDGDHTGHAGRDHARIEVVCAPCGLCPLTFHDKFLLQRFIGFGEFSRPFSDEWIALLADSRLFGHGVTPVRLQHASGCRSSSMRLWYRVVADTYVQWIRSAPSCVMRT